MTKELQRIVEMAKDAYIQVMGFEKWNGLTDEQKHDAIMMIIKGANKALETI